MATEPAIEPLLLNADQAAELLCLPSKKRVYELARSSGLPYVRMGPRSMRFVRSDLAHWIAKRSAGDRG
jgi:excisionase family DNA binding protein